MMVGIPPNDVGRRLNLNDTVDTLQSNDIIMFNIHVLKPALYPTLNDCKVPRQICTSRWDYRSVNTGATF